MPVYNCERGVAEAVLSALDQDYPEKEVLVIDDGSKDGSRAALAQFGDAIRVTTVPNGGPARARNLGMGMAQGQYIAFLGADDVWAYGKLSAQVAHMETQADLGACYTAREVGEFDTALQVGEDEDYWLHLSRNARIDRLDCIGSLYRIVPRSVSRRLYPVNNEFEVLRRAVDRFGLVNPNGLAISAESIERHLDQLAFQNACGHLCASDPRLARRGFAQGLRKHPMRPRQRANRLNAAALSMFSNWGGLFTTLKVSLVAYCMQAWFVALKEVLSLPPAMCTERAAKALKWARTFSWRASAEDDLSIYRDLHEMARAR